MLTGMKLGFSLASGIWRDTQLTRKQQWLYKISWKEGGTDRRYQSLSEILRAARYTAVKPQPLMMVTQEDPYTRNRG